MPDTELFSCDQRRFHSGWLQVSRWAQGESSPAGTLASGGVEISDVNLRASYVSLTAGSLFNVERLVFERLFLIAA